jgi:chromatin remodeling complex protein RSC6
MYTSITSDLRKLQKNMARHVKENSRRNRKRKAPAGDRPKRAPSGFAKPALISKELCSFLGKPTGTEMARTEVTKHLTSYIKEHNLQDQANKRKIIPDAALKKLLNVKPSDELTYFNLQKYMKVHFPKPASAIAAEAAAAAATASA